MAEATTHISPTQIAKFLEGVDLPANRQALVSYVCDRTQAVLQVLEQLPDGDYRTMADVMKAMGHHE
jgi:hypothetical protein